jgi:hypothetical protein
VSTKIEPIKADPPNAKSTEVRMKVTLRIDRAGLALAILGGGLFVYGQPAVAAVRHSHLRHRSPRAAVSEPTLHASDTYRDSWTYHASQSGPFPERLLPDGSVTGPID